MTRGAGNALLAVEGLSVGHGEAIVLSNVSFNLREGESLALLGRNGTGKTTLIESIVGLTRRHAGTLRMYGRNLAGVAPYQRAALGIGWVPQERNIFKSLTVEENLTAIERAPARGANRGSNNLHAWSVARVYAMFPRLKERRSNMGTQLSGGEQQMLAVGRALMLNPTLLLLDEPLEGLAPLIVAELLAAIAAIVREEGVAAIIVEQHPKLILGITDRAIVLDRGSIAHAAASAELLADTAQLDRLLGVEREIARA